MQFEMDYLSARHNVVNVFEFPVFANEDDKELLLLLFFSLLIRLEILLAVTIKIIVFRDVIQHSLVD